MSEIINLGGWAVAGILALILIVETTVLAYVVGWAMSGAVGAWIRATFGSKS